MKRIPPRLALLLVAMPTRPALAAEPMQAWAGPERPFVDADLAFRPTSDEEYAESMSLDAEGADRVRVSATLAATNIGMGDNSAGVRTTLKIAGKSLKSNEEPERWQRRPDGLGLRVGNTHVSGTLSEIRIEHDGKEFGYVLRFVPLVPPWRPGSGRTTFGKDKKRFYEYSLPMPLARVTGRVRSGSTWREFSGIGAVDHSRVNLYPHEQASRWYLFRARTENSMIQFSTFQTTEQYGAQRAGWILVAEGGRIVHQDRRLDLRLSDRRPDPKNPNYKVPWRYDFSDGDRLRGSVTGSAQTARLEYLANMGAVKRWVVSRFAKPIAYTLQADYQVELSSGGSRRALRGTGEMSQTFIK